jgi:hypothetical protein
MGLDSVAEGAPDFLEVEGAEEERRLLALSDMITKHSQKPYGAKWLRPNLYYKAAKHKIRQETTQQYYQPLNITRKRMVNCLNTSQLRHKSSKSKKESKQYSGNRSSNNTSDSLYAC